MSHNIEISMKSFRWKWSHFMARNWRFEICELDSRRGALRLNSVHSMDLIPLTHCGAQMVWSVESLKVNLILSGRNQSFNCLYHGLFGTHSNLFWLSVTSEFAIELKALSKFARIDCPIWFVNWPLLTDGVCTICLWKIMQTSLKLSSLDIW